MLGHGCSKPGKVEVDGKWYCAIHDPEAVKRRDVAMRAKWELERKASEEKWERIRYNQKAGDACRTLGIIDPAELLTHWTRKEGMD
jgi:hypothetical protein